MVPSAKVSVTVVGVAPFTAAARYDTLVNVPAVPSDSVPLVPAVGSSRTLLPVYGWRVNDRPDPVPLANV